MLSAEPACKIVPLRGEPACKIVPLSGELAREFVARGRELGRMFFERGGDLGCKLVSVGCEIRFFLLHHPTGADLRKPLPHRGDLSLVL